MSSSATLGATTLFEFCKELEAIGQTGNATDRLDKVLQLEVEYERVKLALQAQRQSIL